MRVEYCPDCGERLSFDAYHNSLYCTACEYVLSLAPLTQPYSTATLRVGRVGRESSRSRTHAVIKG
jgi:hypothetical protein